MIIEIILGIVAAAVILFFFTKNQHPKIIEKMWINGLVIATLVYVTFALVNMNFEWIGIEIAGVLLYGIFAWLAAKKSILFLSLGWGLHVFWDLLLHPNGHPGLVPDWYPGVCLGFDLVIAGYFLWYYFQKKKRSLSNRERKKMIVCL